MNIIIERIINIIKELYPATLTFSRAIIVSIVLGIIKPEKLSEKLFLIIPMLIYTLYPFLNHILRRVNFEPNNQKQRN